MVLTESEFLEWKQNDVTKQFMNNLKIIREKLKENLVLDIYDNPKFVRGKATAVQEILEMDYNEFMEASRRD